MAPERTPRTLLPSRKVLGDRVPAGADAERAVRAEQVAANGLLAKVEVQGDRADRQPGGEPVEVLLFWAPCFQVG